MTKLRKCFLFLFLATQASNVLQSSNFVIFIPGHKRTASYDYHLTQPIRNNSSEFFVFNWESFSFIRRELTNFFLAIQETTKENNPISPTIPKPKTCFGSNPNIKDSVETSDNEHGLKSPLSSPRRRVFFDSDCSATSLIQQNNGLFEEFFKKLESFVDSSHIEERKIVAATLLAFKIIQKKMEDPSLDVSIVAQGVTASQIAHITSNLLFVTPQQRDGSSPFGSSLLWMVSEQILSSAGMEGKLVALIINLIRTGVVVSREYQRALKAECEEALKYNPEYLDISRAFLERLSRKNKITIKNIFAVGSSFHYQSCFPDMKVVENYFNFYTEKDTKVYGANKLNFPSLIKKNLFFQNHYNIQENIEFKAAQIQNHVYQFRVVRSDPGCCCKSISSEINHTELLIDQGVFKFISKLLADNNLQNNLFKLKIHSDLSATLQNLTKNNPIKNFFYKIRQCSCCYK